MGTVKLKPRVLIVDDDEDVMLSFVGEFQDEFDVIPVTAPVEAVACVDDSVAVAVVDERMPGISGLEILCQLRVEKPEVTRILLTGYEDLDRLAAAINDAGIFRYVTKPWRDEELRQFLRQAAEMHRHREEDREFLRRLQQERDTLASQNQLLIGRDARGFAALIGESQKLKEVIAQARRVLESKTSVVIEGETGTGKELLAKAIHYEGIRQNRIFLAINCAELVESLLTSHLFGIDAGVATGVKRQIGIFEAADGGTLFLDDIQNLSDAAQAALLRVLQEGTIRRVAKNKEIPVDVRIIVATNQDLRAQVEEKRFRNDLYYRLMKFPLVLPPLRERREDIPALARHFLAQLGVTSDKRPRTISADAMRALCCYSFPGNVRELENMIERAALLASGSELELKHFPGLMAATTSTAEALPETKMTRKEYLDECERRYLREALKRADGELAKAAEASGITTRWLRERMQRFGLD